MFAPSVAFVDLETTGTTAGADRITEVGIVRVDDGSGVSATAAPALSRIAASNDDAPETTHAAYNRG